MDNRDRELTLQMLQENVIEFHAECINAEVAFYSTGVQNALILADIDNKEAVMIKDLGNGNYLSIPAGKSFDSIPIDGYYNDGSTFGEGIRNYSNVNAAKMIKKLKNEINEFDIAISKVNCRNDSDLDVVQEIREEKYPLLVKLSELQKSNPNCKASELIGVPVGEIYWDSLYNEEDKFEFSNLAEFKTNVVDEIHNIMRDDIIQILGKFEKNEKDILAADYIQAVIKDFSKMKIPYNSYDFEQFIVISSVMINDEEITCFWALNLIQNSDELIHRFALVYQDKVEEIFDYNNSEIFKVWYINEFLNHNYKIALIHC